MPPREKTLLVSLMADIVALPKITQTNNYDFVATQLPDFGNLMYCFNSVAL